MKNDEDNDSSSSESEWGGFSDNGIDKEEEKIKNEEEGFESDDEESGDNSNTKVTIEYL